MAAVIFGGFQQYVKGPALMKCLPLIALCALRAAPAVAAPVTYIAPLAPARDLPPAGSVTATYDNEANTVRFVVDTAAGALAPGAHQLHVHANYEGNLTIGQDRTTQIKALPPATTDDQDGDGVIEVFEAVPLIGESWWTIATIDVGADGRLTFDSGEIALDDELLFPPDPLEVGSPGVSGPEDVDTPTDIDNIGFLREALDNFGLLAFDIHGALDPGGNGPGEVDGVGGYEPLRPALAGASAPAPSDVPEPGAIGLLGLGLFGMAAARRRRGKAA